MGGRAGQTCKRGDGWESGDRMISMSFSLPDEKHGEGEH